jgi:hypothetical protein
LRRDQQRCRDNKMPSMLAVYLPSSSSSSSPLSVAISNHLSKDEVHPSVKRLQYDGIIKSIKAYLHQLDRGQSGESNVGIATARTPTPEDFSAAIKVLEYLQTEKNLTGKITDSTPLADIMNAINAHMGIDPIFRTAFSSTLDANASRKCYVCRQQILRSESHYLYNALCRPCGSFNLTMSELAYPPKFNLWGKTALVTDRRTRQPRISHCFAITSVRGECHSINTVPSRCRIEIFPTARRGGMVVKVTNYWSRLSDRQ